MLVHANVMVKDVSVILPEVYKIWEDYPISHWVFCDDNSSDNTIDIINELFRGRCTILEGKKSEFSESYNRSRMLEHSRDSRADAVVSIDSDELLSCTILETFDDVIETSMCHDIQYYQYNVCSGSVNYFRNDPAYINNFRPFILPMKHTGKFDLSQYKYHTPRTPVVDLPKFYTRDYGFIHLQSLNRRFYALKQLWYKHFEYCVWGHSVDEINKKYDPVVNGLEFNEADTPDYIIYDIEFNPEIFDKVERHHGYKSYVERNLVRELVTFGDEYLEIAPS